MPQIVSSAEQSAARRPAPAPIAASPAQIAPAFPEKGHLAIPFSDALAQRAVQRQGIMQSCLDARAQGKTPPCALPLHISLFFDGTNNNIEADSAADPVCTSNIARLYHASITDPKANPFGYFSYYIPGVGTVFKDIGETRSSTDGLKFAKGGDSRILFGLTRLVDVLRQTYGLDALAPGEAQGYIRDMEFARYQGQKGVERVRTATKRDRIETMGKAMQSVVSAMQGSQLKILDMRLFVYGFSRGAAEARAFVGRLQEICSDGQFYGIPISIEFLGLMDTVASVGLASVLGGATGHSDWADNTMQLPNDTSLLKRCAHLVSAHEQRLCFPLDSVRMKDGSYPPSCLGEWVYPGVHSDVGGGYGPGEQGKAPKEQGLLISQIPLHHMYRLAFDAGAPLRFDASQLIDVDPDQYAAWKEQEPWRFMTGDRGTPIEFAFKPEMVKRFEAWRQKAGGDAPLADILIQQTAQLTAWRINRYAGGPDSSADPNAVIQSEDYYQRTADHAYAQQQAEQRARARAVKDGATPHMETLTYKDEQGKDQSENFEVDPNKEYEPGEDSTELKAGAQDFAKEYRQVFNAGNYNPEGYLASFVLGFSRPFSEDHWWEYRDIKTKGHDDYSSVMGNQDLVSLYDEHLHDSRCWFMYSSLGGLEPHGSYFRYRTIYFTDGESNKDEMKAPSFPDSNTALPGGRTIRTYR
jgi:hypothetical protein